MSTWVCCSKCWDYLLVDHPFYFGNLFRIDGRLLVDCDLMQPQLRFCTDDLPENLRDRISKRPVRFGNFKNMSEMTEEV